MEGFCCRYQDYLPHEVDAQTMDGILGMYQIHTIHTYIHTYTCMKEDRGRDGSGGLDRWWCWARINGWLDCFACACMS